MSIQISKQAKTRIRKITSNPRSILTPKTSATQSLTASLQSSPRISRNHIDTSMNSFGTFFTNKMDDDALPRKRKKVQKIARLAQQDKWLDEQEIQLCSWNSKLNFETSLIQHKAYAQYLESVSGILKKCPQLQRGIKGLQASTESLVQSYISSQEAILKQYQQEINRNLYNKINRLSKRDNVVQTIGNRDVDPVGFSQIEMMFTPEDAFQEAFQSLSRLKSMQYSGCFDSLVAIYQNLVYSSVDIQPNSTSYLNKSPEMKKSIIQDLPEDMEHILDPMINLFDKTPKAAQIQNGLLNVKTTNALSQTIETCIKGDSFPSDLDDNVKLVSKDVQTEGKYIDPIEFLSREQALSETERKLFEAQAKLQQTMLHLEVAQDKHEKLCTRIDDLNKEVITAERHTVRLKTEKVSLQATAEQLQDAQSGMQIKLRQMSNFSDALQQKTNEKDEKLYTTSQKLNVAQTTLVAAQTELQQRLEQVLDLEKNLDKADTQGQSLTSVLKFVLPRIKDMILRYKITHVLKEGDEKFDPEDKKFEYQENKLEVKEEEVLHLDTPKLPRYRRSDTVGAAHIEGLIRSSTHANPISLLSGGSIDSKAEPGQQVL